LQKPFIDLINQILSLNQSEDYLQNPIKQAKVKEYEKQIDQLVYKLFGLTDDEIKIVENFHKKA
jgi:type II restriction/modification system DNA methylase subunit YeeA